MTSNDPQLRDDDGGSAVVLERFYPHSIGRVWRAVTDPEQLAHWFPGAPEIELRTGGRVRFPEFAGSSAEHGEVLACEPPHLLRFSWDVDIMGFELAADGDGTHLVLTHVFGDRPGAASFATGWEACLEGLTAVLRDEEPADAGPRRERHEQLVHRFGLDHPSVHGSAEGWAVRFERQLVCPAEVAWELFLGGAAEPEVRHEVPAIGQPLRAPRAPEVVLGTVIEVEPPELLAFETGPGEPGDRVRLRLVAGTGHGARLILTVDGTDPGETDAAIEQWGTGAVEAIAEQALRWEP